MTTTKEVRKAFGHLSTAEFQTSDLFDGVRVSVSDEEAGQLFKQIRVRNFNARTKRIGDTLVSHIEAEKSGGIGDLFR